MSKPLRLEAGAREGVVELLARELEREPDVVFAYLHGSFLGELGFRDVDVGVQVASGVAETFPATALAARLSARTGLPVDVRVLNSAPTSFLYHVLRGRLVLCRDEDFLTDTMETVIRRYLDASPLLRRAAREAFVA